jgi:D-3-phosphoglycerate dehydrogenase
LEIKREVDLGAKRVLLPQTIESEATGLLEKAGCEIVLSPNTEAATVIPLLKGVRAIILRTGLKITRKLLSHADDLDIIARTGAGLDNVDLAAATQKGVIVTSNLGVNTSSVVEHVLALILALSKQLPGLDKAVRNENFSIRYRYLPKDLKNKTLGVLGFGRIGSEVGRICHQVFRMRIIAHDPYLPDDVKSSYGKWVDFTDKDNLFAGADIISIHMPLTEETRHAIGAPELSLMKPGAFLINTSRGSVVDESALIETLMANKIAGAGLDVFEKEPVSKDNPLLKLDNVILTPHAAALTNECVVNMAVQAAKCVIDVFDGNQPPNVANIEVLSLDRWKYLSRA